MILGHNKPFIASFSMFFFPLVLITLFLPSKAAAQNAPCSPEPTDMTISHAVGLTCAIDQAGDTDLFRFSATAGTQVRLFFARTSGPGTPCVSLFDSGGVNVLPTYGCTADSLASHINLTTTGVYTIQVNEDRDDSTASYSVTIYQLVPLPPTARAIEFEQTLAGDINPVGEIDVIYFDGTAGTQVRLFFARTSGPGTPCLSLLNSGGTDELPTYGCTNDSLTSHITLSTTGVYTIRIYEDRDDANASYSVTLYQLSPLPPNAITMQLGQTFTGDLNPVGDIDLFSFNASAGTGVRVFFSRTSGPGTPCLSLLNSGGADEFPSYGCTTTSVTRDVTLSTTGVYTIRLYEEGRSDSTASYSISLQCLSLCLPPPPAVSTTSYMPHLALGEGGRRRSHTSTTLRTP